MDEKGQELMSDEEFEEQFGALAIEGGFAEIIGDLRARLLVAPTVVSGALAAVDTTAGGVFTWQNLTGHNCMVEAAINITTASTGAGTMDVGSATTVASNDGLLDGVSTTPAALVTSGKDPGTNGKAQRLVKKNEYVTATMISGAMAGLVGKYYLTLTFLD